MPPAANQNAEQTARDQIDPRLAEAGWHVQEKGALDFNTGQGIAVREYPTDIGPTDYALFVDRHAVSVIDAKTEERGHKITTVEEQATGYATATLKWIQNKQPLPFVYESTGVITRFTDGRDPKPRSREVLTFHRPEMMAETEPRSPEREKIGEAAGETEDNYHVAVIEVIQKLSPAGFEQLTQRLLREAGFTQVVMTGKSGDGGVDHGLLQINPLVTVKVLFQCKRYTHSVSASAIRDFRGRHGRARRQEHCHHNRRVHGGDPPGSFSRRSRTDRALGRREARRPPRKPRIGLKPVTTYEIDEAFFREFQG